LLSQSGLQTVTVVVSARVLSFAYLVLMADKPTTAPQTSTIPTMTAAEKSSSSFLKVIAFFDLVVKLAATGALIGILVLLVQFNNNIDKLFNGSRSLPVRVSDAAPLRIMPGYSGTFDVRMTNNANDPVWFKVDN
jgi:ABC-type transport system involved in cytochrome c biogenesis permease subunit